MAKTSEKLTMRFSGQDYKAMQQLAEQRDCPMAQVLRDALKSYLSASVQPLQEVETCSEPTESISTRVA